MIKWITKNKRSRPEVNVGEVFELETKSYSRVLSDTVRDKDFSLSKNFITF